MTLTSRGWSLLGAALGLFLGGRLLGLDELYVLGTAAVALAVGAALYTGRLSIAMGAQRSLPEHLQVGVDGRVDVTVANDGVTRSTTTACTDLFDGGRRRARFLVAPLDPGEIARAAYRVPTDRRGRFEIGPLRARVGDPFGLAAREWLAAGRDEVIVYPRVHDVLCPPELGGEGLETDSVSVAGRPEIAGDFHTLREYDAGDDLRRVHWKSTARRDRLMVRQDEAHRRAPVLVMLDVRVHAHDRPSFERAVEATASVVTALERAGRPVDVVTTTGRMLGQRGQRHLGSVLDELAVIEPDGPDRIMPALTGRRAHALVAITGALRNNDVDALSLVVRRGGTLVVVSCRSGEAIAPPPRSRTMALHVPPEVGFADTWNNAVLVWQRHDPSTARRSRSLR
jgi:uncharacterized protein (DUF58 family)